MITHIVLFKLRERSRKNMDKALGLLRGLEGAVPTLRGLTVGEDVVRAGRSHDIGLIARFDDLSGLEAYRKDPKHVRVAEHMREISGSIVAVDFEEK